MKLTPDEFKAMVRASFEQACKAKGVEPTDELFEQAIQNDAYFQQQMEKLQQKHVRSRPKPITRAVRLATESLLK